MASYRMSACLFALLVVFPLSAAAEEPARSEAKPAQNGNYSYDFEDDKLLADSLAASGSLIRVRTGAARVMLMRPRLHFVPELLKSAEGL